MAFYMGSPWTDFRDEAVNKLSAKAVQKFKREGIKVTAKTNLGKEFTIFDSANFDMSGKPTANPFLKFGVKVTNKDGDVLTEYGAFPKTDYLKVGVVALPVLLLGLYLARNKFKI